MDNIMSHKNLTFALVPKKHIGFFEIVRDGCMYQAPRLGVNCHYIGSRNGTGEEQAAIIRNLADSGFIDGMAVSVAGGNSTLTNGAIAYALSKNIPVITFDSDAPDSGRLSHIGTDNWAFGATLAKLLLQLRPNGGKYGIITGSEPNIVERTQGIQAFLARSTWQEARNSPADGEASIAKSLDLMESFSLDEEVSAVIAVGAWPMYDKTDDRWISIVNASHDTMTYVNSDSSPRQVNLLRGGYVDGLVGQVPYQWGVVAMNVLHQIATDETHSVKQVVHSTHFMEMIRVPLDLADVVEDQNNLSHLRFVGLGLYIAVCCATVAFALWTFIKRHDRIVRASQPPFLIMVCVGVLILASALIPLSLDEYHATKDTKSDAICMSVPWLISVGFTVTFAALFSKTWRINKIFHQKSGFKRMRVTARDVILPFFVLLSLDLIILTCWTVLAPLHYVRLDHSGTDEWNRVISTYGTCSGDGSLLYILMLGAVNLAALCIALFQAYQARSIQSEFSESAYIGTAMVVILQACAIGFPILFLVQDDPQVFYLVTVMLTFVTSMAVLCLIFVPKISLRGESAAAQTKRLRQSIRFESNGNSIPRRASGSLEARASGGSSGSLRFDHTPWQITNTAEAPNQDCDSSCFMTIAVSKLRPNESKVKDDENQLKEGALDSKPLPEESEGLMLNESVVVDWEDSGDEN